MHNTFHLSCYPKSNAAIEGIMSLFFTMIQLLPCHTRISIMYTKLDGYKNLANKLLFLWSLAVYRNDRWTLPS